MYLTFEVISANASQLGAHRRKVFSVDGGRIGRAPENDMVLPGVGVHRHHATVRFINGVFFVEGVGTNGVAINDPDRVLPRNEPYPLKSGDKVFIDEYEVAVTASATAPAEPAARAAAREPARGAMPESTAPGAGMSGGIGAGMGAGAGMGGRAPIVGAPGDSAEDLDPLRKLTGGAAPQARVQRPVDSSWNHSSSLQDHFAPPPVGNAPTQAASGSVIPENWDRTSFDRSKLQPAAPAPAQRAAPSGARATPANTTATPRATPPPPSPRVTSPPANSPFDWEAFLRAAGVDASRVPPETAAIMGSILRSVVQGLIEVLRARSEIKTEFRMPVTQVKVSENNPLKFAANAEDALGNLLGRRNTAYLPPQEAFEDALNDVRFHQLAMLAGVRAGFENLMDRFDPVQLQEVFDRQGKRGGLFGGKGNYWERYAERYQEMSADRDETFRRLFGEEFARAYEQQLSVLKRSRGGAQ